MWEISQRGGGVTNLDYRSIVMFCYVFLQACHHILSDQGHTYHGETLGTIIYNIFTKSGLGTRNKPIKIYTDSFLLPHPEEPQTDLQVQAPGRDLCSSETARTLTLILDLSIHPHVSILFLYSNFPCCNMLFPRGNNWTNSMHTLCCTLYRYIHRVK